MQGGHADIEEVVWVELRLGKIELPDIIRGFWQQLTAQLQKLYETLTNETQIKTRYRVGNTTGYADNEEPDWVSLRLGKIADWRQQFLGPLAEMPNMISNFLHKF